MERWTGTPEGTCNVLRTFRETHAISAMASSTTGCEGELSGLNHWTRTTQGTACSRAAFLGSGRQSCEPELNFTQKTSTPALKASVLFFFIIELLSVPYELPYDEPLESQPTLRKYFLQLLNHRIRHRQYVEYPRQLPYCG